MMTREQMQELPQKAANRAEIDAFNYLSASLTNMIEDSPALEKRARLIPGGWRDLRMITKKLEILLKTMMFTFEPEKRAHIQRTSRRIRLKTFIGRQVVQEENEFVIGETDMGVLIYASSKNCELCMGRASDCKQCTLGRTLDATSYISRENRAWWEVFEKSKRMDIGMEENP